MTPETDDESWTTVWLERKLEEGRAIMNIDSNLGAYKNISEILDACALDPDSIEDRGEVVHDGDKSKTVRIGKYAVKEFKFDDDASPWERERRAGLNAARVAVMFEIGLARLRGEFIVPVSVPHLHACFYPEDPNRAPLWIMAYHNNEPDPALISPDILQDLQGHLDKAILRVGGERFLNTLQTGNQPSNWLVKKHQGTVTGLVKVGGSIRPDYASKSVWEREAKLFRL